MIKTFADKETEKIYAGIVSRRLPFDIQQVARRKLRQLNNAETLNDVRIPPANRLEALKGDYKGFYSIRVNNQWRIIFRFVDGDVFDVEMIDYH
ncbi:MAG: type II toxin-antitoxin system RelE/ParE family toxin [Rickettsiales bacterium]